MSATILRAPRSAANPAVLGTRLIGDHHKTSTVVSQLAIMARFNPIGLADLFEFDAWMTLAPLDTSQENERDVYGVGELWPDAVADRSPYAPKAWRAGEDDVYLLFGTDLVWMHHMLVLAYGFREPSQMVDPDLKRHGVDSYERFDLLNPITWSNTEAIARYAHQEERAIEKRRRLRIGEGVNPTFNYLG